MKGKVTCTCGWSWNKSDSSAKDMYICHECGRDNSNNMKNGGWLDGYDKAQEGKTLSAPPKSQYKRLYGHANDYSLGKKEKMRIDPNTGYGYFPPELSTTQQKEVPNSPWNTSRFLFDPFIMNESQGVHNSKYDKEGKIIELPGDFSSKSYRFTNNLNRREKYDAAKKDITSYYKEDLKLNDDEVEKKVDDTMDLIRKMRRTEEMMQKHNAHYKDFQNPEEVFKSAVGFNELFPVDSMMGDFKFNPRQAKRAYKMFQKTWRGTSGKEARQNSREELKKAQEAFELAKEQMKEELPKPDPNYVPENFANGGTMQEHQENYNDSYVALPKGFVGMGNNTKGRNYSPAWGGQFQMGGKLNSSIPVIEDAGGYNEDGIWVPDWEAMTAQAKKLGAKKVKTKHGSLIVFDDNWEVIGVDDNPDAPDEVNNSDPRATMQTGGSVYPVNYVPQAQDGILEDAMRGMMKSKIGMGNAFGHPAIKRMSQAMPKTGMTPEGQGTHYMSSVDNYAVPLLQDLGEEELTLIDPDSRSREAIRFNSPEEAEYFAEHYKEVAPMSTTFRDLNSFQTGGSIPGSVGFTYARTNDPAPSEGPYAKKTMASAQGGKKIKIKDERLERRVVKDNTAVKSVMPEKKKRIIENDLKLIDTNQKKIEDAKAYYKKYLNSPKAKERITNMMDDPSGSKYAYLYDDEVNPVDQEIKNRLAGLNKLQGKFEYANDFGNDSSSYYDTKKNSIFIRPNSDINIGYYNDPEYTPYRMDVENTIGHEIGHGIQQASNKDSNNVWFSNGIGKKESDMLMRANMGIINAENREQILKDKDNPEFKYNLDHDNRPSELKADIDALRYQLYRQGIYDAGTQDFTREHLEKAKPSFTKSRLNEHFTDDELIDLMNKLSYNEINSDGITSIAQNGKEMRYYQNGLDWKPKGMKNGGWLDGYEKAQDGTQINGDKLLKILNDINNRKTSEPIGPYRTNVNLDPNSEEYANAYKDNNVFRYDENTDTYIGRELPELVIQGKPKEKGFWSQYADNVVKEHQGDGPLGAIIGTPLDAVFGLPSKALMYGLTGKVQRPSQAMMLNNGVEAFVADVGADPLTYMMGTGILTKENAFSKLGKMPTSITSELGQGFRQPEIFSRYITPKEAAVARAERMLAQESKWNVNSNNYTKDKFTNINDNFEEVFANEIGKSPEVLGTNSLGKAFVFKDNGLSTANQARVAAHETGHFYRNMADEANEWNSFFDFSKLKHRTKVYLKGKATASGSSNVKSEVKGLNLKKEGVPHGDEIRERAAQLKDYIAQKNGIPLNKDFTVTQTQLDDAIENYVKDTGLDNTMSPMLNSLKDKKGFLNAMNKYALGAVPLAVGAGAASQIEQKREGGIIKDDMGYWNPENWNSPVEIGSNNITMQDVPFDVLGISDEGDVQHMKANSPKNYKYKGKKVTEFRMAKNGLRQEQKGLVNLDQLTNFTNYNKPQPGGWLSKYE